MSTLHFSDPVALANIAINCVFEPIDSSSGQTWFRIYCDKLAMVSEANTATFNAHYGENARGVTAQEIAAEKLTAMKKGAHLSDALRVASMLWSNIETEDIDVTSALCDVMTALCRKAANSR